MISIKLRAADIKLLQTAATEGELRGVVDMILHKVAVAEQEREFARGSALAKEREDAPKFNAGAAVGILKEIFGEHARVPPYPEKSYYINIARAIKSWGMTEDYVRKLGEQVVKTLKPPFVISWVFNNHERIMGGAVWGQASKQAWRTSDKPSVGRGAWHGGTLDTELKLD